jgi:hypothetical protein
MKKYGLSLLLLVAHTALWAQTHRLSPNYLEAGFMFGVTNYSGDVAESNIEWSETQPGFGMFLRYHITRKFSVKGHFYSGSISGDDANSPTLAERNLRFSTSLTEFALVLEWNFLAKDRISPTGVHSPQWTPYFFFGVGSTFADSKTEYYGPPEKYDIYFKTPLPEPGLDQQFLLIPMGFGLRVDVLERLILGADVGWRPVLSDDLDGISINGNPDKDDWYYFGGITASFILNNPNKHRK